MKFKFYDNVECKLISYVLMLRTNFDTNIYKMLHKLILWLMEFPLNIRILFCKIPRAEFYCTACINKQQSASNSWGLTHKLIVKICFPPQRSCLPTLILTILDFVKPCYGLTVCVPQNSYIEILTTKVMASGGGGAFGRWGLYKRDPREVSRPLCQVRTQWEDGHLWTWKQALTRHWIY